MVIGYWGVVINFLYGVEDGLPCWLCLGGKNGDGVGGGGIAVVGRKK